MVAYVYKLTIEKRSMTLLTVLLSMCGLGLPFCSQVDVEEFFQLFFSDEGFAKDFHTKCGDDGMLNSPFLQTFYFHILFLLDTWLQHGIRHSEGHWSIFSSVGAIFFVRGVVRPQLVHLL